MDELKARGHQVSTVDLPASDPHAGYEAHVAAAGRVTAAGPGAVVVGHSLGGILLPVLASRHPVARTVYLTAIVPIPGRALTDRVGEPGAAGPDAELLFHDDGTATFPPDRAAEVFYGDCTPADQAWAIPRLRRQGFALTGERCPIDAMPDVPADYIVASDDRALAPDWCRWMARELLGVEPHELPGGHSPFLAQPGRLADLLVSCTEPAPLDA